MPKSDVQVENPTWAVDTSGWRMKQIKTWQKAVAVADIDGMNALITESVKDADGNALTVEALDDLTFDQWREVAKLVGESLVGLFRTEG